MSSRIIVWSWLFSSSMRFIGYAMFYTKIRFGIDQTTQSPVKRIFGHNTEAPLSRRQYDGTAVVIMPRRRMNAYAS